MPVTAAQLAADEFLSNIIGSGIVVKEGCVQDVTLEAFEERCLASNAAVPVTRGAKSMSILTKQFDACVEKRSKWDQMAFVESGTGGLRFVRTLKVSCQRGDIDAVEFLLPRDDKGEATRYHVHPAAPWIFLTATIPSRICTLNPSPHSLQGIKMLCLERR